MKSLKGEKETGNMKVTFVERRVTLKDTFKEKFCAKLDKFDKIFDETAKATVTASMVKDTYILELTIFYNNAIFRVEESNADCWAGMDEIIEDLKKQIRKYKTKIEKTVKRSFVEEDFSALEPDYDAEEELEFEIARTKKVPVKPMSADEAILQMNLLGHEFFAFRSAETGNVDIVYKRKDGRYGLIETE